MNKLTESEQAEFDRVKALSACILTDIENRAIELGVPPRQIAIALVYTLAMRVRFQADLSPDTNYEELGELMVKGLRSSLADLKDAPAT